MAPGVAAPAPWLEAPVIPVFRCACGGSCPQCSKDSESTTESIEDGPTVQPKLSVSQPGDAYEREADKVADAVMRAPEGRDPVAPPTLRGVPSWRPDRVGVPLRGEGEASSSARTVAHRCACGGSCPRCSAKTAASDHGAVTVQQALATPGRALDGATRDFLEPRFGVDLGALRVHDGGEPAESARRLGARAYAVGRHIVFGSGEYAPHTESGRRLLAHEVTHTLQQRDSPRVQRTLLVKGPEDPADPAASIPGLDRNNQIEALIQQLGGPTFVVTGRSAPSGEIEGEVESTGGHCADPDATASGSKPVGTCCLCVLIDSPNIWTIHLTQDRVSTSRSGRIVRMRPTTAPIRSGHFTAAGARVMRPAVISFGHELCGHAALHEVGAHPPSGSTAPRTTTTMHDAPVRVERGIWDEQGLPAARRRGLAANPTHHGESFMRIVVRGFPFNRSALSLLAPAERDKIAVAVRVGFLRPHNNRWIDIIGHSDRVGTPSAKQDVSDRRARAVRQRLRDLGVPATIDVNADHVPTPPGRPPVARSVNRFTEVRGVSDRQATCARCGATRRVEIFISSFPAGAARPVSTTPATGTTVAPEDVRGARRRRSTANACELKIMEAAWPTGF